PIYRFDKSAQATTSLTPGEVSELPGQSRIDAALAAGVLSADEAHSLHQAEAARRAVIDVDDFAKEELTLGSGKVR
ncbi:acyl-CoA dehydrogenase domain-containing protein, partial [Pseudomonas sp.]|uniref:acyl-CoA dehydrogenase domain-containing protein n=1 Tax=Pseudomonas sp. TaxID=306 RepID=UPI0040540ACB